MFVLSRQFCTLAFVLRRVFWRDAFVYGARVCAAAQRECCWQRCQGSSCGRETLAIDRQSTSMNKGGLLDAVVVDI